MKQHITIEQFQELPNKLQNTLYEWSYDKQYGVYEDVDDWNTKLLTIGQMIEFIVSRTGYVYIVRSDAQFSFYWSANNNTGNDCCDMLWKTVKEILSKK